MARPILPIFCPGSPLVIFTQEFPPSILLYIEVPGPPPKYAATFLCLCQVAAYKISGFFGWIRRSVTPVHSFTSRVFFQVDPPSSLLYNPLSPPELQRGPWAATQIVLAFVG